MQYKLLIFDIDDTLFDYRKTEQYALLSTCRDFSISVTTSHLYEYYRKANNVAHEAIGKITIENVNCFRLKRIECFFTLLGLTCDYPYSFLKTMLLYSRKGYLMDGVLETISSMNGLILVAATNGTDLPRKEKLLNSPIAVYIDSYYSAEILGTSKPNSSFFETIISNYNIPKQKVLVIGDSLNTDILGAQKTGVRSCWFNWKNENVALADIHPNYIINKFSDLLKILNS